MGVPYVVSWQLSPTSAPFRLELAENGDLDLALDLTRTSGRASKAVSVELVRQLNAADLVLLDTEKGIKPNAIKRLRDSHHTMARLVAEGLSGTEIAARTGYSQSRISILKSDPAFAELVAFYKSNVEEVRDAAFAEGMTKLAAAFNDAVEELQNRLHDNPELMSTDQVLDVIKATADRIGLGPASKSTNLNVTYNLAARVAAGRQALERLSAAPQAETPVTIEHESPAGDGVGTKNE